MKINIIADNKTVKLHIILPRILTISRIKSVSFHFKNKKTLKLTQRKYQILKIIKSIYSATLLKLYYIFASRSGDVSFLSFLDLPNQHQNKESETKTVTPTTFLTK